MVSANYFDLEMDVPDEQVRASARNQNRDTVEVCLSAPQTTGNVSSYDVVILGAGYAGLIAALRLGRQKWGLRVALVNPRAQFLERVRLQESIVAPVTPRIPSISAFFVGTTIQSICGSGLRSMQSNDVSGSRLTHKSWKSHSIRPSTRWVHTSMRTLFRASLSTPIGSIPATVRQRFEVAGEIKTTWPRAELRTEGTHIHAGPKGHGDE
jgi:hypothetical protein